MGGNKKQKAVPVLNKTTDYANDLNKFYARFDCHDFEHEREQVKEMLVSEPKHKQSEVIVVSEEEVLSILKHTNPNKASGPDGVRSNVLKLCAVQNSLLYF
jgi:hypothetical protein